MDRAEGITPMHAAAYVAVFIAIDLAFTLVPTGWLEELTAQTTSAALSLLGLRSTWANGAGSPWLTLLGYRTVTIVRECTVIDGRQREVRPRRRGPSDMQRWGGPDDS